MRTLRQWFRYFLDRLPRVLLPPKVRHIGTLIQTEIQPIPLPFVLASSPGHRFIAVASLNPLRIVSGGGWGKRVYQSKWFLHDFDGIGQEDE